MLPGCCRVSTTVCLHHLEFNETIPEKEELRKNAAYYFAANSRDNIVENCSCTAIYHSSYKPYKEGKKDTLVTAENVRTNS